MFTGKKAIVIGDRDGIPGPAIAEVIKTMGAEVIFASTECFVWTAAGAMDLEIQKRVKEFAEGEDRDNLIVILGGAEAEAAGLAAETVLSGDPTFAGPLAGVALNLPVYHVVEAIIKDNCDPQVYDDQIGMMEMVLDVEAICSEMDDIRSSCAA